MSLGLLLLWPMAALASPVRVRKELRSLSRGEYRALVSGLATMLAVPTTAGRLLWGPRYVSYTDLLMKHAVAANDPRGDQGHNGPPLMTFHRAWLLELEVSLLAVAPRLKAIPYWDLTLDAPGGKHYGTDRYMFSEHYAGHLDGNSRAGNAATTGVFGWRPVPRYVAAQWPKKVAAIYNGTASGLMRSYSNLNPSTLISRLPTANVLPAIPTLVADCADLAEAFASTFLKQGGNNRSWAINYSQRDYRRCTNPRRNRNWLQWTWCVDFSALAAANLSAAQEAKFVGRHTGVTSLLHAGVHITVGSFASGDDILTKGDLADVATSPNEVLLFITHHANLDRSALSWQGAAARLDPGMVRKSWGYPATTAQYPSAVPGTLLDDVVNSNYAFTQRLFDTPPASTEGYTHREVLHLSRQGACPYTYDRMED